MRYDSAPSLFYLIGREDPAIPSDNNASEKGTDAFHALHSIADTAWKNGQSPLEAILALV